MKISKKEQKLQAKIRKLLVAGVPLTVLLTAGGCVEESETPHPVAGARPNIEEREGWRLIGEPPERPKKPVPPPSPEVKDKEKPAPQPPVENKDKKSTDQSELKK
ncbi:MAG: hypothetical protein E7040_11990 [Lentisphaerae bacterium]|nr:hypothetical protein [Lentisphaerota bacterium]